MKNYKTLKLACYMSSFAMASMANMSPILFMTFRSQYGISYSKLGLLVLLNYATQLFVDLIFSFFSHKFDISKSVKSTPFVGTVGMLIYALWPFVFPNSVYTGLVIGTLIFSVSAGLGEVLISPVIAAIPAKDPDREMSKLHSLFAWGVVFFIVVSTLFLQLFGLHNWQYLALMFCIIPIVSCVLFLKSDIPEIETPKQISGALKQMKNKTLWMCVFAIFLGGAAECTMSQWGSGYLERALGLDKVYGDLFGVAMFGLTLGIGRSLYAKIGKNITKVLFLGAIGASVCYLTAAITNHALFGLIACGFTGFCVSMMWPGMLIVVSDYIPKAGVLVFAMMAAGGDLGASIGPQLVGVVTDAVIASDKATLLAQSLALTPDQLGMKLGMLIGAIFPMIAIALYFYIHKTKKKFT